MDGSVVELDRAKADAGRKAHDRVAMMPVRRSVERMEQPSVRALMTATCCSKGSTFMGPIRFRDWPRGDFGNRRRTCYISNSIDAHGDQSGS